MKKLKIAFVLAFSSAIVVSTTFAAFNITGTSVSGPLSVTIDPVVVEENSYTCVSDVSVDGVKYFSADDPTLVDDKIEIQFSFDPYVYYYYDNNEDLGESQPIGGLGCANILITIDLPNYSANSNPMLASDIETLPINFYLYLGTDTTSTTGMALINTYSASNNTITLSILVDDPLAESYTQGSLYWMNSIFGSGVDDWLLLKESKKQVFTVVVDFNVANFDHTYEPTPNKNNFTGGQISLSVVPVGGE